MFENEIRLDNTKRECFATCMQKGYLQYVKNIQGSTGSIALLFGLTWHGCLKGFYETIKELGWEHRDQAIANAIVEATNTWNKEVKLREYMVDYRSLKTVCDAFLEYVSFHDHDTNLLRVIDTEKVFACSITLETEEEKRLFGYLPPIVYTGRLDLQVDLGGSDWIIENKSTGGNLGLQAFRLHRSPQIMGYSYAAPRVLDFQVEGCMVSFLYASARKNKEGVYGKVSLDFKRVPQLFNKADLRAWKMSFLEDCAKIHEAEQAGYWQTNHYNCYTVYGGCPYIRLCEQNRPFDELNLDGFQEFVWDVEQEESD